MTDRNDNALARLNGIVQDDPDLQERLFGLQDTGDFIAEVQRLAASSGLKLEEDAVKQAMRAAQISWIERTLP